MAAANENARRQPGATTIGKHLQSAGYTPGSVRAAVLADLIAGRCLTHMDCWREHGSSRLAAHIYKLRRAGWPIIAETIAVPTSGGHTAYVARYQLPSEART